MRGMYRPHVILITQLCVFARFRAKMNACASAAAASFPPLTKKACERLRAQTLVHLLNYTRRWQFVDTAPRFD